MGINVVFGEIKDNKQLHCSTIHAHSCLFDRRTREIVKAAVVVAIANNNNISNTNGNRQRLRLIGLNWEMN